MHTSASSSTSLRSCAISLHDVFLLLSPDFQAEIRAASAGEETAAFRTAVHGAQQSKFRTRRRNDLMIIPRTMSGDDLFNNPLT